MWKKLLLVCDAQIDGDSDHRGDNRKNPADPVNTGGFSNTKQTSYPASDKRANSAQDDGPENRNILLTLHEQAGKGANNSTPQ